MSNTATATTKEVKPYLTWGFGAEYYEEDYDCMLDDLTSMMRKINKGGQWHCTVENFGWQSRNGWLNVIATDGSTLLRRILPNTDCSFKIFVMGKGFGRYFRIQNFHHDSPVGNEWYEVRRFNGRIHPAT